MKSVIIALALAMPITAAAECVKFDYAELKDMSQKELRAAYSANQAGALQALNQGNVFLENGDRGGYRQQDKVYQECEDQARQIERVWSRRFPGSIKE